MKFVDTFVHDTKSGFQVPVVLPAISNTKSNNICTANTHISERGGWRLRSRCLGIYHCIQQITIDP